MKKFYGNYLGVVTRTDDPEGRGRVKVYVPHVSATVYEEWNALEEDKVFNFPGDNTSPDLSKIIEKLNKILPWAECAAPLIGAGSQGRYTADPNPPASDPGTGGTGTGGTGADGTGGTGADTGGTGTDTGGAGTGDTGPTVEIFTSNNTQTPNTTTGNSNPVLPTGDGGDTGISLTDQNAPRPDTGTIQDGDLSNPALNQEPDGTEIEPPILEGNKDLQEKPAALVEEAQPVDGHRDTKNDPPLRANYHAETYAAPAYSNVAKGMFSTPNVGAHVWVFYDSGDPLKPVFWAQAFGATDWASVRGAGSYQQDDKRFSRENPGQHNDKYRGNLVLNERGGTFEIINTEGREMLSLIGYHGNNIRLGENVSVLAANNDQKLVLKDQFLTVNNDRNVVVRNNSDTCVYGDIYRKAGHITSYHQVYQQIYNKIKPVHDKIALYERKRSPKAVRGSPLQTKEGTPAKCPVCTPGEKYSTRIGAADTFNLNGLTLDIAPSVEKSPILTYGKSEIKTGYFGTGGEIFEKICKTCNGSGQSPSSEHGNWQIDQDKQQAAQEMLGQIDDLADLEAKLGPGGSEIVTVAKDYTVTVGLIMNDMESVRTDPHGKLIPRGMKVNKQGVYRQKLDSPIMEVVPTHPAFPGGNYDFTVMNRYNVLVGSGGIFFKTKGVVQTAGTINNLNGDQILITSMNETKVTAGRSFSVNADIISLGPTKAEQVLIDGGLAVARNAVIAGGCHIEGELSVHHISAPVEYQLTELVAPGAKCRTDRIIGYVDPSSGCGCAGVPVYGSGLPDTVVVDAHRHWFKNLPLSLHATSDDVRDKADPTNKPELNIAQAKYTKGNVGPDFREGIDVDPQID